jgi:hypothetical protein
VARYLVGSLVVLGVAACGKQWLAERESWRHEAEVACLKSGQVKESPTLVRSDPITGPGICGADFPLKVAAIGEGSMMGYAEELRPPGSIPGPRQPLAYPPPPAPNYSAVPPPQYQQPYPGPQGYPQQQAYPPQYPAQQYPTQQAYPQQQQAYPAPQPYPAQQAYPPQPYRPAGQSVNRPMSIYAPGITPPEPEPAEDESDQPDDSAQPYPQRAPAHGAPYRPNVRAPSYPPPSQPYPSQPYPSQAYPPQSYPSQPHPSQSYPAQPYPAQPAEQVPLGRERGPVTTGAVAVQPTATLACPIVSSLDNWFSTGVQPAALKWFGVQVAEIRQISAYSCRGMNGQPGARISEHAFGNALDIASFTLADGRKITVKDGWRGSPEEQGFLRDVHASACQLFTTVLAPGSNAFHYDHIHVDLMRRSSRRQICNPVAVSGDVVAARAGYRFARGEPGITGSIKQQPATQPARKPAFFQPFGRDEVYDRLPRAVPGED